MIRTQISLTEEQHERLRALAAERGESMSALIREAIDAVGAVDRRREAHRRLLAWARDSGFRSGDTDVSENHDTYLYGAERR
ncbi:MAG: ribbon-helix-helix domain-containing protein [Acidimicrobiia bacterium]|nr:ribbon-helix-helix domain-containing protein [Acidimicrobiia bacterium]